MSEAPEYGPVCDCGHPAEDHSAGECWWDVARNRQDDDPADGDQCPCDALVFTGRPWGPVGAEGGKL